MESNQSKANKGDQLLELPNRYRPVRVRTVSSPVLPQDAVAEIILTAVGVEANNTSSPAVVKIDAQGSDFQDTRSGKPYVLIFDPDELLCARPALSLVTHIVSPVSTPLVHFAR